jgi:hypothetical protein
MPIDVYVTDAHPYYQVWVDGAVYDDMVSRPGFPTLTWSQQWDIANGYKEALSDQACSRSD